MAGTGWRWRGSALDPALYGIDPREDPASWGGRARVLSDDGARCVVRVPLPGTPDESGRLTGRPAGLGTGYLVVTRWRRTPWRELMRARVTRPRSASAAERDWNLLCLLRAAGVGTPDPLAVGTSERGAGDSVLVTRELERCLELPAWLETARGEVRRLGLAALGGTLRRIAAAGVELPRLHAEHVRLTEPACGLEILDGGACSAGPPDPAADPTAGMRRNKAPGVALASVEGARQREGADTDGAFEALLAPLRSALGDDEPAVRASTLA